MQTFADLWGTLTEPVSTFRLLARTPRALVALVLLMLVNLTLPWAVGSRLQTRQSVLQKLGPEISEMTDRDIDDAVIKDQKLSLAIMVVAAVAGPPFRALILALGLWLWARYLYRRPRFGALFALATFAQLPLAIRSLATALAALGQAQLSSQQLARLLPSGPAVWFEVAPVWERLLGGLDFFTLWTATLLGIAFWVTTEMPQRRAAIGMAVAYVAYVAVFLVGFPGLLGG